MSKLQKQKIKTVLRNKITTSLLPLLKMSMCMTPLLLDVTCCWTKPVTNTICRQRENYTHVNAVIKNNSMHFLYLEKNDYFRLHADSQNWFTRIEQVLNSITILFPFLHTASLGTYWLKYYIVAFCRIKLSIMITMNTKKIINK